MITTKLIKNNFIWIIIVIMLSAGCTPSHMSIEDLICSNAADEVYVNIRCCPIDSKDTLNICSPYSSILYYLEQDSSTILLCDNLNDYVLHGEILRLPKNHTLLKNTYVPDSSVDSVYAKEYKNLLVKYFFCHDELEKNNCCCLDWLHSVTGNSVYFGHRDTPCYCRDGDSMMSDNMQDYIISLLYQNEIFCSLDDNGNICLAKFNLKIEDISHIPFPIVEIR